MAASASQIAALGNDVQFQLRIRSLLQQVAATVYAEQAAVPDTRRNFAKQVLVNPNVSANVAVLIASRPNLTVSVVSYDFAASRVVTDATDGAILAQITSDWSLLAGV